MEAQVIEFRGGRGDRKTAIVGAAIIASLLIAARGAPAWNRWRLSAAKSASSVIAEDALARATVARRDELNQLAKGAELLQMEIEPAFVGGSDITGSTAALASVVSEVGSRYGLRLGALEPANNAADAGSTRRVSVRADASGDAAAITHFLAALESGLPLLAVRELTVTRTGSRTRPGESLHVDFVVEGIARVDRSDGRQ